MCRCAANTTSRVVSVWRLGSDVKRMFMNVMLTVIWIMASIMKIVMGHMKKRQ